jgi:acyl-CoA synthetase (AMP-forming)/AMP-acid ligase II
MKKVIDDSGYLFVTGRHKDMIISGGENIHPREIDEFIFQMEGVGDDQVAGIPGRGMGRRWGRLPSESRVRISIRKTSASLVVLPFPGFSGSAGPAAPANPACLGGESGPVGEKTRPGGGHL